MNFTAKLLVAAVTVAEVFQIEVGAQNIPEMGETVSETCTSLDSSDIQTGCKAQTSDGNLDHFQNLILNVFAKGG